MPKSKQACGGQRGAVLLMVAVAILALLAFSVLVIDYGVMWASRRQAQNSADAAALAGALSMSVSAVGDQDAAIAALAAAAAANPVWAAAPVSNLDASVVFQECPVASPGLPDTCVRAEVFRDFAN